MESQIHAFKVKSCYDSYTGITFRHISQRSNSVCFKEGKNLFGSLKTKVYYLLMLDAKEYSRIILTTKIAKHSFCHAGN